MSGNSSSCHLNVYRYKHHQVAVFLAEHDAKQCEYDKKESGLSVFCSIVSFVAAEFY